MTFLKKLTIFSCLISSVCFANFSLKPGTYNLEGSNPNSNRINYRGKVIIRPFGELYECIWLIGSYQSQKGTAILEGDVLSVNFFDLGSRSFGVVSYRLVAEDQLEGKWACFSSETYGKEFLSYESENIFP